MAKKKNKTQQKGQKRFSEKEYMRTRMRTLPIGKCYISPEDDDSEVVVFVTREHPAGTVSLGIYLIDKYCCGVKDAVCRFSLDPADVEDILDKHRRTFGVKEIPYEVAHNLIYGALEYAESIGIPPHKDFEIAQYILAEDNDDIPLIEYEFGKDGRPTLMCHSLLEIDRYKKLMLKKLQPDEFDVVYIGKEAEYDDAEPEDVDNYEPEDDMVEAESTEYTNESLGLKPENRSNDIQSLDTARKVAFFMMTNALAKKVKSVDERIASFAETAEQALLNYRKYGDVAFGKAASLLFEVMSWIFDANNTKLSKVSEDESDTLFRLSMAYAHSVDALNIMQYDYVRQAIDDIRNGAELLLEDLDQRISIITASVRHLISIKEDPESSGTMRFDVAGLREFAKWTKKGVKTHVKKFNYGFRSKDPQNYYRRKVREAVETRFVDPDDFMGLVINFYNLTLCTLDLLSEGDDGSALHILYNIVSETVWAVCNGKFRQWTDDLSVRDGLKVMLSNAVTILANMIIRERVDNTNVSIIHKEFQRISMAMNGVDADIVDLHPVIYSAEVIMYQKN